MRRFAWCFALLAAACNNSALSGPDTPDGSLAGDLLAPQACVPACAADQWCDFPPLLCGGRGECRIRPMDCVGETGPATCGCDGKRYANDCLRQAAGVSRGDDIKGCLAREVGEACARDSDCFGGECVTMAPFVGGYCSVRIGECPAPGGTGGPCPSGSECINPGIPATGGADYCVKRCASNDECRAADGYRCCPRVQGHAGPFCYPIALCL